jgi:hypothetical protein
MFCCSALDAFLKEASAISSAALKVTTIIVLGSYSLPDVRDRALFKETNHKQVQVQVRNTTIIINFPLFFYPGCL